MFNREVENEASGTKHTGALIALTFVVCVGALELGSCAFTALVKPTEFATSIERNRAIQEVASNALNRRKDAIVVFDPHLGWRPQANVNTGIDHINSQELRAKHEYSLKPAEGIQRIAVYGDSFVYGSEVSTQAAWTSVLEHSRENLEVLNYGVPGYGPDQAFLRFDSTIGDLGPQVVILGITTPSLGRILTISPVFQTATPHFIAKPRFILNEENELELVPSPVSSLEILAEYAQNPERITELGVFDYWYEPLIHRNLLYDASHFAKVIAHGWNKLWRRYLDPDRPLIGAPGQGVFNDQSSGFFILTEIIKEFDSIASELGMVPIVALLPDGYSVEASRNGHKAIMAPVHEYCVSEGIHVLDLTQAFLSQPASTPLDEWFFTRFHYTEAGNALVATWLSEHLEHLGVFEP